VSDVWDDLRAIDPPVGEGGRDWFPYMLRSEVRDAIAAFPDPVAALAERLEHERDPVWREVLLFGLAGQDDPRVDPILIRALDDPAMRPRALYLLGAIGTRGWPKRERDRDALLAAIRPYITDPKPYRDPILGEALVTADLAEAAFVRIAGPEHFPSVDALADDAQPLAGEFVGMALPHFSEDQRAALAADIERFGEATPARR
jgi:hypothetical protein